MEEKRSLLERIKALGKTTKMIISAAAVLAVCVVVLLVVFAGSGEVKIDARSALKEVLISAELHTAKYTYNSIAEVKGEKETKYYVAYKGTVPVGFNFEKIEFVEKNNKLYVVVPEIEIYAPDVNEKLEYIFVKEKYDTGKTFEEAYAACQNDLKEKAQKSENLRTMAIESAIEFVSGLVKPFEGKLGEGVSVEVVYMNLEGEGSK